MLQAAINDLFYFMPPGLSTNGLKWKKNATQFRTFGLKKNKFRDTFSYLCARQFPRQAYAIMSHETISYTFAIS